MIIPEMGERDMSIRITGQITDFRAYDRERRRVADAERAKIEKQMSSASATVEINNQPVQSFGKIVSRNNSVRINDPFRDYMMEHADSLFVTEQGIEVWGTKEPVDDADIYGDISKEELNFWLRLTGDPTFLAMDYSDDEVRCRLADAGVKTGFFAVSVGNKSAIQFLSQSKTTGAVHSKEQYDRKYELAKIDPMYEEFEVGYKFLIGGKEYTLDENKRLDIPYGEDIFDFRDAE